MSDQPRGPAASAQPPAGEREGDLPLTGPGIADPSGGDAARTAPGSVAPDDRAPPRPGPRTAGHEDERLPRTGPGIAEPAAGAGEGVRRLADTAATLGGSAPDAARTAKDRAGEAVGRARGAVSKAVQRARDASRGIAERAGDLGGTARTRAGSAAENTSGGASSGADRIGDTFDRRPEIFVGAAFAGGLVVAKILDALGGDDDEQ